MQFQLSPFFSISQPIILKEFSIKSSFIVIPETKSTLSLLNSKSGVDIGFGYLSIIPGTHSASAYSSNRPIILQKASSAAFGSAPLSKRLDASVDKLIDFALLRTVGGSKYALSIISVVVLLLTALTEPPITPAIATGIFPFVIKSSFGETFRSTSSSVIIDSFFLPRRINISFDPN